MTASVIPARLLVVDDDPEIREALVAALELEGHRVEAASDGKDALTLLRGTTELPEAVLLDLRMPKMDGWMFRKEQRRDPALSGIPVLVLSADESPQAETIDAAAFLRKPVQLQELLSEVRRVVAEARQQKARAQEAHTERLASLGRLAAGVAHEINNPLSWMSANLRLLAERLPEVVAAARPALRSARSDADELLDELAPLLSESLEGAARIRDVVAQVKAFAQPQPSALVESIVEVRPVIEEAIKMMELEARHRVTVVRSFADVPPVHAAQTQLSQLFVNLLINAADAVAATERGSGTIEVKTSTTPAGEVVVEIADDGIGMSESTRRRMFDPFFTTKPSGRGTGLGLFLCHGIVERLGGRIQVQSEPGRGATVSVTLAPAARPQPERPAVSAAHAPPRLKLLVVEDEPVLLRALDRVLKRRHEVLLASSVDDALNILDRGDGVQAILCDVHMPEKGGAELFAELEARGSPLAGRALFMSGGAISDASRAFIERMGDRVLTKPLELAQLEAALAALTSSAG